MCFWTRQVMQICHLSLKKELLRSFWGPDPDMVIKNLDYWRSNGLRCDNFRIKCGVCKTENRQRNSLYRYTDETSHELDI